MPAAEVAAVVQFEARGIFPFDTDEAKVDFLIAGEVRQGTDVRQEVIVLAARCADVDRFVEQLHRTGLVVDSLDVEPCSLYRTIDRFVRRREDEQEVHVLVDVGSRGTQVLIGKGREISFFKAIEMGGADFNLDVSRKLGIRPDEARALRRRFWTHAETDETVRQAVLDATRSTMENLTREICLCLRYHSVTFRGQRAVKVRVSGGEGGEAQLPGQVVFRAGDSGRAVPSVVQSGMLGDARGGPPRPRGRMDRCAGTGAETNGGEIRRSRRNPARRHSPVAQDPGRRSRRRFPR